MGAEAGRGQVDRYWHTLLAGLRASIVSGGVLCVLGTVALAAMLPRFWNYDAREGARLRTAQGA